MTGSRSRDSRRRAEARGRTAERLAELRLMLTGWRVVDRRARTGAGEIDLVAVRGGVLSFIEVKARADVEAALQAVSFRQRERLLRAGALWRGRHARFAHLQPRFDLMVVTPGRWPKRVENAFQAETRNAQDLI
ncbi:MAG: YraN family protein [Oceanicaulis sp.]